ncbi:MAG: hypothetical protein EOP22_04780 [Hyphomicrobiales bacterium]|nr:MAG: hypothetical protein EOP22_04780 [Hyphomicrobiales bacterium]
MTINAPAAAAPAKPDAHSPGFNLGVIALVVAMAGLGLAYGIDAMGRSAKTAVAGTLERTLGSARLDIPASWFREDAERSEGFAKQVELAIPLALGPEGAVRQIDVTLLPRSRVRPSASLLDGVYLHQFTDEQASGPLGLIGKPLAPREGFAGETVWYDALSAAPFVAKCLEPLTAETSGRCLRTVYLGPGIAAVYSFDADILDKWREFDAQLHPLLKQIGAL